MTTERTGPIGNEPDEFEALARFNSERAKGLVHSGEWVERMKAEQARFDQQQRDRIYAENSHVEETEWGIIYWNEPPSRRSWWWRLVRIGRPSEGSDAER